jgi:hypothetical protein
MGQKPAGGLLLLTDRFEDRFASSSPRASSKSTAHVGSCRASRASSGLLFDLEETYGAISSDCGSCHGFTTRFFPPVSDAGNVVALWIVPFRMTGHGVGRHVVHPYLS